MEPKVLIINDEADTLLDLVTSLDIVEASFYSLLFCIQT
jgi:hypothetical protein